MESRLATFAQESTVSGEVFCVRDKTDPGNCMKEINVVGITYALTHLLIKFCYPGQKRFVGKVCDIHNADKYIGEKAGGKRQ